MDTEKNTSSENRLQHLRVLYVEDDPDTLRELSRFLKKRVGFLATAGNGTEALEACAKYPVDIVITDLRMPGMDGLSFVRELRNRGSRCPVVITSAFSDSDTILQAVDLGIVKYCIKPLNPAELVLTLEKLALEKLQEAGALLPEQSLDRQHKLELEKKIRSELAHLLKALTGKGPKDIQVVLGARTLTIRISEAFTLMETTLLKNPANAGLVSYFRKTLYTEIRSAIEELFEESLGTRGVLADIEVDIPGQWDRLTLHF